ncbi:band 4.1-like protein 4 isoform X3 [Coregonus clupeaformis]|uniref:band 4.1-like protein 4 isoform X3 n=1 Tax=Coregonus clupeaformis TaxID=59861 RepID=UPI001E1C3ECC|nr:band 4.1-like protein 4 isoform X3 [Coregonus clupeaformis]
MSCFCTAQEEFYCEVLLLDETKLTLTTQQQGIKKSTKASVVLDFVFNHVKLAETDYFGLRYCDHSHQTYWLDPSKTLSEHKDLITTGPPYTLYFGVKFYAENPCKLKEEITRYQFFLQVKQDVLQGRIPCPLDISAQLAALAIQSELGDYDPYKHVSGYVSEYRFVPDQKEELEDAIETIHKTVMEQVPSKAELNYLGIAKTLDMYGVDLHPVFGENQSEYFLGLTPIGVVVYKNKTQVGKYFWPRITKVHFKETQFELRVVGKDCTETSFFFKAPNKTACKHLWKCCIEHHTFFRMPENDGNTLTRKLSKLGSLGSKHRYSGKTAMQMGRDPSVSLPRPDLQVVRTRSKTYPKRPSQSTGLNNANRSNTKTENAEKEGTAKITAQSAVKSSNVTKTENGGPEKQRGKPSAPWDENAPQSGLYNTANQRTKSPKFPMARGRTPSGGSENETSQNRRWLTLVLSINCPGVSCAQGGHTPQKSEGAQRKAMPVIQQIPQTRTISRRGGHAPVATPVVAASPRTPPGSIVKRGTDLVRRMRWWTLVLSGKPCSAVRKRGLRKTQTTAAHDTVLDRGVQMCRLKSSCGGTSRRSWWTLLLI